jgi:hypothetical protein
LRVLTEGLWRPVERAAVDDRWDDLSVECYAGYRGEETPIRFRLHDADLKWTVPTRSSPADDERAFEANMKVR